MKRWMPLLFLLAACGPKADELSQTDRNACPSAAYPVQHEATVYFSGAIPAKLGLQLDGEWKHSDCASYTERPPIVRFSRSGNAVSFVVQHFDAYPSLPEKFSFKLVGSEDCAVPFTDVFVVQDFPLKFVTDYPNGKQCGSRTRAVATFIKQ